MQSARGVDAGDDDDGRSALPSSALIAANLHPRLALVRGNFSALMPFARKSGASRRRRPDRAFASLGQSFALTCAWS